MSTEPVRVPSGLTPKVFTLGHDNTNPTLIFAKDVGTPPDAPLTGMRVVKNTDAAITIYLAEVHDDMTDTTKCWPLTPGETFTFSGAGRIHTGNLYAVGASGAPKLATMVL